MQSSTSSTVAQPEAILEWLQKEMGYRPLGPYTASSKAAAMPTADSLRKICRGNMIPVWNFLLKRVKSEKTVENIRRNILVHGGDDGAGGGVGSSSSSASADSGKVVEKSRGRRKEKSGAGKESSSGGAGVGLGSAENSKEIALQERDLAEKEVERLRQMVRRQRKELKARMLEVSREETERKRVLDERFNYRFGVKTNRLFCLVPLF